MEHQRLHARKRLQTARGTRKVRELRQAGDSRSIAVRDLRRDPPAVPEAQRPNPTNSGEQGIIPTVTTINALDDLQGIHAPRREGAGRRRKRR